MSFLILFGAVLVLNVCRIRSDDTVKFFITSVNCAIENRDTSGSSIRISGKEYSKRQDGLNIIAYDLQKYTVTSIGAFSNTNSRKYSHFFNKIKPGSLVIITSQLLCSKDSSTDLKIQKSNLYGLNKLGFKIRGVAPLRLRSAAYLFCKGKCSSNITFSINLPYQALHDFNEDPILISFTLYNAAGTDVVKVKNNESKSNSIILYTVVFTSGILILLSVMIVFFIWYRKHRTQTRNLQTHYTSCLSIDDNQKCQCELIHCSMEDFNAEFQLTTSARMFTRHNRMTTNSGGVEKTFATYTRVDSEEGKPSLYKIPSGVSKYDPPSRAPSTHLTKPAYQASCSTLAESYIMPHEYANPEGKSMERYEISEKEIDDNAKFIDSTLGNFSEYTSLEPYLQEEYHVPQTEEESDIK